MRRFLIPFVIGIAFLFIINLIFSNLMQNNFHSLVLADSLELTSSDSVKSINRVDNPPIYDNKAFELGEELVFKIRYGFVKAGKAVMKIKSLEERGSKMVYHIQTTARSVSGFDWIYKVRDEVNSFVDYHGLYPLRFEKKLREGGYKADLFVDYFHEDSIAKVEFIRYEKNMDVRKIKKSTIKIPPYANDILSAFYLVRNQNIEVGKPIYLTTNEKEKVYDLEISVYGKEIIEVEAGKFRCFQIEPLLKGEGIFKQKGRLKVWLTDDEYKIPVQMTSEVVIGHITTELVEIKGVKKPLPSQVK